MSVKEPASDGISYKVQIWKTEVRQGKRLHEGKPKMTYLVRWAVANKPKKRQFTSSALAEAFRSDLVSAARKGEAFDVATGLPVSQIRKDTPTTSWYRHACAYVDMKWDDAAPKSRVGIAETLATVTAALLTAEKGTPEPELMRKALYTWAFNTSKRTRGTTRENAEPPEELASAVQWLEGHTLPITELDDAVVMRRALDTIGRTLNGSKAAASTVYRKRAVFHNALEYAVELGYFDANPLKKVKKKAPKTKEAVNPAVLPDRRRAEALFTAVGARTDTGRQLVAYFGCIYYAALRPAEVAELRLADFKPPAKAGQWGEFHLRKSAPSVASGWSNSGTHRREARQLKHRAVDDFRSVPCHPRLARMITEHVKQYGTAPDGRLFRGARGGPVADSVISQVWRDARAKALSKEDLAAGIALRPYDLRHACVTTWLNAGVDPAQVAAWAGHSVVVLLRVYVQCIVGRDEIARRRIEAAFDDDGEDTLPDVTEAPTEPPPPTEEE